ncbi:SSH4 [Candida jiufengensis]|uniref:SSH4 n=1 Tax=Candida jiufengensis TaxID=497108 RepID=UPI002224681C|nr:SSH4 [Candida jiufengensis]KAI5949352.1 SSH4 [Candida jiufengensis]
MFKMIQKYDDSTNILLIIVSFSITIILSFIFCIYKLFFSKSRYQNGEYQTLSSSITDSLMGSHSNDVPREFLNDEESLKHLAEQFDFTNLSPEEQQQYLKSQEFAIINPPDFNKTKGKTFSLDDEKIIKEYGINAFKFEMENDILNPHYIIADKTEINFNNNDLPYCTTTTSLNYPLPVRNRLYSDTIYFETKIFEFQQSTNTQHFAIGLITKPYPTSFRLPGYNKFSIAYESTGNLKINKPFPTPLQQHLDEQSQYNALVLPPLQQSDVVGFGYVIPTGTIFITRNGKKLLDVMKGCFVDMYPAIGCFSTNAKFQVNLGQSGFVWIEANVRKYGFVSTSDYKKLQGDRGLAHLPQYNKILNNDTNDKILDKGEELPPRYIIEEELDFFGRSSNDITRVGSSAQHMKLNEKGFNKYGSTDDTEINDEHYQSPDDEDDEEHEEIKSHHNNDVNITNDPEDIMDLRERLYEHDIRNANNNLNELDQQDSQDSDESQELQQKPKSQSQAHPQEQVQEQVQAPPQSQVQIQPQNQEPAQHQQQETTQPEELVQESTQAQVSVDTQQPQQQNSEADKDKSQNESSTTASPQSTTETASDEPQAEKSQPIVPDPEQNSKTDTTQTTVPTEITQSIENGETVDNGEVENDEDNEESTSTNNVKSNSPSSSGNKKKKKKTPKKKNNKKKRK